MSYSYIDDLIEEIVINDYYHGDVTVFEDPDERIEAIRLGQRLAANMGYTFHAADSSNEPKTAKRHIPNIYRLEKVQINELEACWNIMKDGMKFQREHHFTKYAEDYADIDTIRRDIEEGKGYAMKAGKMIVCYMCIDFDSAPAYDDINVEWKTKKPYAAVYRMAFRRYFRGHGLADTAFRLIDELCISQGVMNIRTAAESVNSIMYRVLEKNGFHERGIIIFKDSLKIAYDKRLKNS